MPGGAQLRHQHRIKATFELERHALRPPRLAEQPARRGDGRLQSLPEHCVTAEDRGLRLRLALTACCSVNYAAAVIEQRQCRTERMERLAACADNAHLSFSRFLNLFKQEVGTPFRSFRAWKRARALLHYVTRDASLTHVALDTGYPDSTHFSHSIRQVYGLKPKDIFAGSRRLSVLADDSSER